MLVTPRQLAALYALRRASVVFDVSEEPSGRPTESVLIVTSAAGFRWRVTQDGATQKIIEEAA